MVQAFLDYGPPRYPRAALWDAIARIVCHFGVEEEPELALQPRAPENLR
jgi:hypothetical protein